MSSYDLSSLSPADAVVALRSFPRRYREVLRPIDDDESIDEMAQRLGPDGRSALEVAVDTVRTWALQREALRQIQLADTPVVHPAVLDPAERHWEIPADDDVASVVAQLADGATDLADDIERVPSGDWTRHANAAGGRSISALDIVREAVRVGRDDLDEATRILTAVRSR